MHLHCLFILSSLVLSFPVHNTEQLQCEPRVGGSMVSEGLIAKNLASPNGHPPCHGFNNLITCENALAPSTSKCYSVHLATPTCNVVPCLSLVRMMSGHKAHPVPCKQVNKTLSLPQKAPVSLHVSTSVYL